MNYVGANNNSSKNRPTVKGSNRGNADGYHKSQDAVALHFRALHLYLLDPQQEKTTKDLTERNHLETLFKYYPSFPYIDHEVDISAEDFDAFILKLEATDITLYLNFKGYGTSTKKSFRYEFWRMNPSASGRGKNKLVPTGFSHDKFPTRVDWSAWAANSKVNPIVVVPANPYPPYTCEPGYSISYNLFLRLAANFKLPILFLV